MSTSLPCVASLGSLIFGCSAGISDKVNKVRFKLVWVLKLVHKCMTMSWHLMFGSKKLVLSAAACVRVSPIASYWKRCCF